MSVDLDLNVYRLCWEQNVHVIVMLTREFESATEKCGTYWTEGTYGPLQLKVLESNLITINWTFNHTFVFFVILSSR